MNVKRLWSRMSLLAWITAGALVILVGLILLGLVGVLPFTVSYLLFVVLTIDVVRSVPVEPGAWLGLRVVRRALVALIGLLTLGQLLTPGLNVPLLVALMLSDFALGRATRRIASAPRDVLDERQDVWRNHAYQVAYVIFAVVVGGVLVVADLAAPATRQWLATNIQLGGALIGFFQLLLFLPSMVIAWNEPDRVSDADAPRLRNGLGPRLAAVMVSLCLITPLLLSLWLAVAPIKVTAYTEAQTMPGQAGSTCTYLSARKEVGIGVQATVPLNAVACWDGTKAYESWGMNSSDCVVFLGELTTVSTLECRRTTDAQGTLHFIFRGQAHPIFLPFIARDLTLRVDMTKDGKVVQFP